MMCDEKNYIFFFLFCKKNVPLRYYKEPKINSMIPNFQYPTPIDREVNWDKSKTIMSRTDAAGVIDYVNQVFCDVCGYSTEELLGSPHNIIRHPDMPRVIFKVLWDNIQQGINFHAVAKNLAKSGEYYWVVTDFDIIKDAQGKIISYLARRTSVPTQSVEKYIAPLYAKMLQVEAVGGMEASGAYLANFLKENGYIDYIDFIENAILEFK